MKRFRTRKSRAGSRQLLATALSATVVKVDIKSIHSHLTEKLDMLSNLVKIPADLYPQLLRHFDYPSLLQCILVSQSFRQCSEHVLATRYVHPQFLAPLLTWKSPEGSIHSTCPMLRGKPLRNSSERFGDELIRFAYAASSWVKPLDYTESDFDSQRSWVKQGKGTLARLFPKSFASILSGPNESVHFHREEHKDGDNWSGGKEAQSLLFLMPDATFCYLFLGDYVSRTSRTMLHYGYKGTWSRGSENVVSLVADFASFRYFYSWSYQPQGEVKGNAPDVQLVECTLKGYGRTRKLKHCKLCKDRGLVKK